MTGFGKDGRGQILYDRANNAATFENLGAGDHVLFAPYVLEEDFRLLRADLYFHLSNLTAGSGPVLVGICDTELTLAELEECLGAQPVDSNDNSALERSHRPVWILGWTDPQGDDVANTRLQGEFHWDKRWTFSATEGWTFWAWNPGPTALGASADLDFLAKYYGV